MLAPGSRPPTESVQDVQHTGFFQAVVKSAHTHECMLTGIVHGEAKPVCIS